MKGNKGNTFLDQKTYKRAPVKCHLCAWPFRSCLNEAGEQQTARDRDRRLKFNSDTIEHF